MEKVKLEDNIMEKMRSQLTLDKASVYTKKMTDKLRRRATELVTMNFFYCILVIRTVLKCTMCSSSLWNLETLLPELFEFVLHPLLTLMVPIIRGLTIYM